MEIFGGCTTLEKADIPNMDKLSRAGLNGTHDPVQTNLACGSDTAHMSLFGLDPFKDYNGRGAFETMGAGVDMQEGEIAFKSNFALMDDETEIVLKRRADRQFEWGIPLCDAINGLDITDYLPEYLKEEKYEISCKYATEHR